MYNPQKSQSLRSQGRTEKRTQTEGDPGVMTTKDSMCIEPQRILLEQLVKLKWALRTRW